jgi:hypothetical protein
MFWIALAAEFSAALPINYSTWWSPDDMPAYVQLEGTTRVVLTRTVLKPDGTLDRCDVERTSGDAKLDAFTCALVVRRGKYTAARWLDGSPVYGVDRIPVTWAIEGSARPDFPADMELSLGQFPKGTHAGAVVRISVAADEAGRPVSCAAEPKRWPGQHEDNPVLVDLACAQALRSYHVTAPKTDHGESARSVQSAMVRFVRR